MGEKHKDPEKLMQMQKTNAKIKKDKGQSERQEEENENIQDRVKEAWAEEYEAKCKSDKKTAKENINQVRANQEKTTGKVSAWIKTANQARKAKTE